MKARDAVSVVFGNRRLVVIVAACVALALAVVPASALAAPTPSVEPVTNFSIVTAKVSGTVLTDEAAETYWGFQYRPVLDGQGPEDNWQNGPQNFVGPLPAETSSPVEDTLVGLNSDTEYEVRLFAVPFSDFETYYSPEPHQTFKTDPATNPPVVAVPAAESVTDSEALIKGTIDPEGGNTDPVSGPIPINWELQLNQEGAGWNTVESGTISDPEATGSDPITVEKQLTGLEPATDYAFRLRVTYAGQLAPLAEDEFKTDALPPTLSDAGRRQVGAGKFEVGGFVNPRNSALTDCRVEYGLTESYGQSVACAGLPPVNNQKNPIRAEISGLTVGATYHARISVTNVAGTVVSGDRTFTVRQSFTPQPCGANPAPGAGFLPDCRAWEMVSQASKNGAEVLQSSSRTRAASDGNAMLYSSLTGFGDVRGSSIATEFIARRSGTGWVTHAVTPLQDPLTVIAAIQDYEPRYEGELSDDLSTGVYRSWSPLDTAPNVAAAPGLYVRRDLLSPGPGTYERFNGCPASVCSDPLPPPVLAQHVTRIAGASADLGEVIFESVYTLAPGPAPPDPFCLTIFSFGCEPKLYKSRPGEMPEYVGLIPAPGDSSCGGGGPECDVAPRAKAGRGATLAPQRTPRTITEDGSRVFFMVGASPSAIAGALYMRDDQGTADPADDTTSTIAGVGGADATYETASSGVDAEGNRAPVRVFFTTAEQLAGDDGNGSVDLYVYDTAKAEGDRVSLVSVHGQPDDVRPVDGVIGASEDGRYVYFIDKPINIDGQTETDTDSRRLYVWHEGTVTYIGRLSASTDNGANLPTIIATQPASRVTTDGRHLLFVAGLSKGLLSVRGGVDAQTTGQGQLYLYSADTDELECASCGTSANPNTSEAGVGVRKGASGSGGTTRLSHALSEDGRFVFFHTAAALVAEDRNGMPDVYRYDARTGAASLVSSGTSNGNSFFIDATPDGSDVFFTTSERLVGWDRDDSIDLYDARIGGGFAEPPAEPAECRGETCRGLPGSTPGDAGAGSANLVGAGNPKPPKRCGKGQRQVRRNGKARCVKKAKGKQKAKGKRTANTNRRAGR